MLLTQADIKKIIDHADGGCCRSSAGGCSSCEDIPPTIRDYYSRGLGRTLHDFRERHREQLAFLRDVLAGVEPTVPESGRSTALRAADAHSRMRTALHECGHAAVALH